MNSKIVAGWLLIVGPILGVLVIGILWEAFIGSGNTAAESISEMMDNPQLSRILLAIGSVAFVSTFLGLTLLARSMRGEGKLGSEYASVAAILFSGLAAIGVAATGLSLGAIDAAKDVMAEGAVIELVGSAMFAGLFLFWGIGNIVLGVAIVLQKNLHVVAGGLLGLIGALMVILSILDIDASDSTVGMVVWILMTLTTVAVGILTLLRVRYTS